jgi:hypothetical protein
MTTPFELRAQMLHLARDILLEKQSLERTKADNEYFYKREQEASNGGQDNLTYPVIDPITTEDIIAEAKKLNAFVSTSSN